MFPLFACHEKHGLSPAFSISLLEVICGSTSVIALYSGQQASSESGVTCGFYMRALQSSRARLCLAICKVQ